MFCARCGHSMSASEKFCDQCGARAEAGAVTGVGAWHGPVLASVAQAAPPAPVTPAPPPPSAAPLTSVPPPVRAPQVSPGAAPPARPSRALPAVLLVVFLLGLALLLGVAALAWHFLPGLLASGPSATPTPTSQAPPSNPTSTSQPGSLEPFLGTWTTPESSSEEITLRQEGDTLVAAIPSEEGEIRLSRLSPGDSTLHGSYTARGESIPLSAELSADGTRLTLTLAPPQSEFERVVLVRKGETSIPGIERLDPADPSTYLPLLDLQLTFEVHYPDGDSGQTRAVVANLGDEAARSVLMLATSAMDPGSTHAQVVHYVLRSDGLHRLAEGSDELWLPARAVPGARWSSQGWQCRVRSTGTPLDLGFERFDCLVVERQNDQVQVSETVWMAPGYGEVLVKEGGAEAWRLTGTELLDPAEATRQVREHAAH